MATTETKEALLGRGDGVVGYSSPQLINLNGSAIAIPNVDDLSADYFTACLRESGALAPNAKILQFKSKPIGDGMSGAHVFLVYNIEYDPPMALMPDSMVVKMSVNQTMPLSGFGGFVSRLVMMLSRNLNEHNCSMEFNFYGNWKQASAEAGVSSPNVYYNALELRPQNRCSYLCCASPAPTRACIFMEDLSEWWRHPVGYSMQRPLVRAGLLTLARLHARFWGSEMLEELPSPSLLPLFGFGGMLVGRTVGCFSPGSAVLETVRRRWPAAAVLGMPGLEGLVRQLCAPGVAQRLADRMLAIIGTRQTFAHGDFHGNNLTWSPRILAAKGGALPAAELEALAVQPDDLKVLDFQCCGAGAGLGDVIYFCKFQADVEGDSDVELVRTYHAELTSGEGRVAGYSLEQCQEEFDALALYLFMAEMQSMAQVRDAAAVATIAEEKSSEEMDVLVVVESNQLRALQRGLAVARRRPEWVTA